MTTDDGVDSFSFHHHRRLHGKGHSHLSRAAHSFPIRMDNQVVLARDNLIFGSTVGSRNVGGDDEDDDEGEDDGSSFAVLPSRRRHHSFVIHTLFLEFPCCILVASFQRVCQRKKPLAA